MDILNQAFESIESLKTVNASLYEKLYDRILYDTLMPRYLLLRHYAKEAFTDMTFAKEVAQFKADAKHLGVTSAQHTNIQDLVLSR